MRNLFTSIAMLFVATPALAHHPLGGLPMESFSQGLLSGLGHPVLGFDHLFFVIAMGIAALFVVRRYLTPVAYIGAMLAGCGLMYTGTALPMAETMVAISLLVMGGIVLSGRALGAGTTLILFATFGLFHGSALGDSIAAQEGGVSPSVLLGYLIGLGVIQYAIALSAGWAVKAFLGATDSRSVHARIVGAMVAGVGAFLCLERIEGPIVALIAG